MAKLRWIRDVSYDSLEHQTSTIFGIGRYCAGDILPVATEE